MSRDALVVTVTIAMTLTLATSATITPRRPAFALQADGDTFSALA